MMLYAAFFFQAEDGIRDLTVTGVQTCALPIFISFLQLGQIRESLDNRSFVIATFALCGFANFGSIAIQVGGIGALAPDRRHDLASLGLKAMIAGTLANFLSATIAGIIL